MKIEKKIKLKERGRKRVGNKREKREGENFLRRAGKIKGKEKVRRGEGRQVSISDGEMKEKENSWGRKRRGYRRDGVAGRGGSGKVSREEEVRREATREWGGGGKEVT